MRKMTASSLYALIIVGAAAITGCHAEARIGGSETPPQPEAKPAETTPTPEAKPEPPKQEFKTEGNQLLLPGPVTFETGKDVLLPESDAVLQIVHDYLVAKPEVTTMRIEGHTDNVGKKEANQTLSEGRAMAVARWLVAKGVACKRVLPVGFGDSKPVASNDTPEGKAQNRRTAFINAALNDKPIMRLPVDGGGKVAGDPCK